MTLFDVKKQVDTLGERINAPQTLLPTYGYSADGALPHIEIDSSGKFHFVVVERGRELERRTTAIFDERLFWVFDTITFSMACAFELENRNHTQDFRRLLFNKQEELLGCTSVAWQEKKRSQHSLLVAEHPFADGVFTS